MVAVLLLLSIVWTGAWWADAWLHAAPLSASSFFPLWVGYIVVLNAASELLWGTSLMRKMGWRFGVLFALSIPLWWFFEYLNTIVNNWHYLMQATPLQFAVQASLDFSTVVPAVLSAAFLFRQFMPERGKARRARVAPALLYLCVLAAGAAFMLMPVRPDLLFPFVWIAPLLVIDPLNYWLGFPSVLAYLAGGRWRTVFAMAIGTLFTGFWWEMWNFFSYPKWVYTVPYVGFWKVFEMPLLGYGGYLFFGLSVWSFAVLVLSLLGMRAAARTIA